MTIWHAVDRQGALEGWSVLMWAAMLFTRKEGQDKSVLSWFVMVRCPYMCETDVLARGVE